MSAKIKIITFFGLLITTIITLSAINSYSNFKSYSNKSTTDSLALEANLIADVLDQQMAQYFFGLRLMSDDLAINTSGDITDETHLKQQLVQVENNLEMFGAAFGQIDGTTYNSKGIIANFNAKKLDREWYKNAIADKRNATTVPYINNVGDLVMSLSVPVKRNGKIVGILNANISVDTISNSVKQSSRENQIFVSREDGYLLASNNPEHIGQNIFELRPSYSHFKDQSGSNHYYNLNAERYYVINSKVKELGWVVWSWERVAVIDLSANDNLIQSVIIAIVTILIALVATYIIVNKLMYIPIGGEPKDIEKLVDQIAKGDLSVAGTESGKETGIYASIFVMLIRLKSSIENINQATKELTMSAEQTSISAIELNNSSEAQMLQIEQTSTAMNELTVTAQEVASNAVQASTAAQEAFLHADNGMLVVNEMSKSISRLVKGIENVVTVNSQLEIETQSIGSILEVIDGISEQTNLLALNAAIEAARAGEHGRGFAVVADEVRNLANRTKESTSEIQEMISKLQLQAKKSVDLMNDNVKDAQETTNKSKQASSALDAIRSSVTIIEDMNSQIATAAEEQTHVATEINTSIVQINDEAKTTVERSKGNKTQADKLAEISLHIKESVDVFHY
tara:strand:+ start:14959 stop:16842 length:1884 start_codon:yes stop_codon:yes gene_type:complete